MAAKISGYLLRLAIEPAEQRKFRRSEESAEQAMKDAGLPKKHRDLLLHGTARQISEAVNAEMPSKLAGNASVVPVSMSMSVCRTW